MLYTAFILGLLGSFHCVGMCGPIAFALPISKRNNTQLIKSRVLYNLGRIATYTLLGAIVGVLGLPRPVLLGLFWRVVVCCPLLVVSLSCAAIKQRRAVYRGLVLLLSLYLAQVSMDIRFPPFAVRPVRRCLCVAVTTC